MSRLYLSVSKTLVVCLSADEQLMGGCGGCGGGRGGGAEVREG